MTTSVLAYIPSPSQGVWHLGPFPLRAYALFIIVGIIAALVIGDRRWAARGGEPGVIYDVALWAVPFGLIGGRLYHVMTDWPTYFGDNGVGAAAAVRIWDGGLGIWGAVAFGAVGAWIACRRRGIPLPAFGDAIAPGIVLAQGIGRLGNYFNQELYGRETTVPWGLEIYERVNSAGVPDSLNGVSTGELIQVVHPTFLYELLWNLLVFVVLILVDRRFRIGHGRLFALYVAGYCLGRFWIELMRSDTATLIAGIRVNTFTATFVFIGAVVYIMVAPKGREDPASLRGDHPTEDAADMAKDAVVASAVGIAAAAKVADEDEARETSEDKTDVDALVAELEGAEPDTERVGADESDKTAEVDVDAVTGAVADAAVVHDAAAEVEGDAAELAAEMEGDAAVEAEGDAAVEVEGDEAVGGVGEVDVDAVTEAGPEGVSGVGDVDAGDTEAVEGLGAVEGGELAEAVVDAAVVHEAAVESEGDAAELAVEVEGDAAAEVEGDAAELAAEVEGDAAVGGVGEVDVDAVTEAGPEGVSGVGDVDAGDVEAVEGLGAVEGGELAEAVADAAVVHEAAVESEGDAAELAAEVEGDAAAEVEGDAAELAAEVEGDAAVGGVGDVDAGDTEAVEGLGAVEGDEVAEAVADAAVVHEAAVESEADAAELTEEVEQQADAAEATEKSTPDDTNNESGAAHQPVAESSSASARSEVVNRVRGWIRRRRGR
ncbi:hypothetical protein ACNUDN_02700 [Mycobacterium sp. smrl_JER01]|uniref:prolipoprotein diacylglyceryl transferase n=1 Tax=Mycobacterium sp. smrl_JER01 TaxID=3402633 RepID=UPI003D70EA99